jgi:hypothetical protein
MERRQSSCPYLVGSHRAIGHELGRWLSKDCRAIILDIVPMAKDYEHIAKAFDNALEVVD